MKFLIFYLFIYVIFLRYDPVRWFSAGAFARLIVQMLKI